MALTVEDGTGVSNADSYISIVDAVAYHETMGNTAFTNRPDLHEVALRNATTVIDMRYGLHYRGTLQSNTQSLLFPRTTFTDNNGRQILSNTIPQSLKHSVAELALVYITDGGELIKNKSKEDNLQQESIEVGNGAVKETKAYFSAITEKTTTKSDILIAPLLKSASGMMTASRG